MSLARLGDSAGSGVAVLTSTGGIGSVACNGATVAGFGSTVTPHGTGGHNSATVAGASGSVFANGVPVSRAGDILTCAGHSINAGSGNVFAG